MATEPPGGSTMPGAGFITAEGGMTFSYYSNIIGNANSRWPGGAGHV
jgi:hypothetical protein